VTNVEFLDDVERRGAKGDIFTGAERKRLRLLLGWDRLKDDEEDIFMSSTAVVLAQAARVRCKWRAVDRIKESQ
jgi:hypothetical protein